MSTEKKKNASAKGATATKKTIGNAEKTEVKAKNGNTNPAAIPEIPKEPTFSQSEVEAMIQAAVSKALLEQKAAPAVAPIVQVVPEESVAVLFVGAVAEGTEVSLGGLGQISRNGGTLDLPKKQFLQSISGSLEKLLRKRKLIVISGLTDEERERYGILYAEGEMITQREYDKFLDYDLETLKEIYAKLCDEHKETMARIVHDAYFGRADRPNSAKDPRITLSKVKMLNKLSKGVSKDGLFKAVLDDMGAKLSEEE